MPESDRERWDSRYRREEPSAEPSGFLADLDHVLPRRGRALDVAGGAGRNAVWMAARGLDVTLADLSAEGLAISSRRAEEAGLPLRTVQVDLELDPLPRGPWDVVLVVDFLWRPLFAGIAEALAPGGVLVVSHPTRSNLLRHERPSGRHLLEGCELPGLVAGLEVVWSREGWDDAGRYTARLVARRRPMRDVSGAGRTPSSNEPASPQ